MNSCLIYYSGGDWNQGEIGNKYFNVYLSVGVLWALEHDPEVEAVAFFPTFYFGIT